MIQYKYKRNNGFVIAFVLPLISPKVAKACNIGSSEGMVNAAHTLMRWQSMLHYEDAELALNGRAIDL